MPTETTTFRAEEVQEILGNPPPSLVRWGNTVFLLILVCLLLLSWFISYPEIVSAPFRLVSTQNPKPIVAKVNGRIVQLLAKDQVFVTANQPIAYLESTAQHAEVLRLETILVGIDSAFDTGQLIEVYQFRPERFKNLGTLQSAFQAFVQTHSQAKSFFANGFYERKERLLTAELSDLVRSQANLTDQLQLHEQTLRLATQEFEIQQKLYHEKAIALLDYNHEEAKWLAKKQPVKQTEMALTSNQAQQTTKQKELLELEKQATELKIALQQALQTLLSEVATWKNQYILTASQTGQLNYTSLWQEQQPVKMGETVFYVGNKQPDILGEVSIGQAQVGKVAVGQTVLVRFHSYPFEQFGEVSGLVRSIADIPSADSTYRAIITLPRALTTSSNKKIQFRNGLSARADIVTQDQRLIQRFFYKLIRQAKERN